MLSRHDLESLAERLIDHLDAIDPDPDTEDDDPDTSVEDDPKGFDPETDYGAEEAGEEDLPIGAFCDPVALAANRNRIRRTRCVRDYRRTLDWRTGKAVYEPTGYLLYLEPVAPNKRQLFRRKRGVPKQPRA